MDEHGAMLPGGAKRARVLLISPDLPALPGFPVTGAGLRAWGLGEGLRARGHEVQFAVAQSTAEATGYRPDGQALVFDPLGLQKLVDAQRPDVLLFQHWPMVGYLHRRYPHTIIDCHGPILLETVFRLGEEVPSLYYAKLEALARADFFTCPGERQRNYFYGWLALAGFDLRQIPIAVVPFSLSPELPNHEYPDELQFVYGGVFLPWQNPGVGLRILLEELEAAGQGRLHFFGGKHPCLFMPEKTFEGVQALLQSSRRATVLAAVPRTELLERYCRASAAWDLMPHNCERGMAITSRTIEYLWTGLPVVYNNYAELAESIRDYDAGWLVDPDDEGAIRATARAVLADPDAVRRKGQNAQRLVRERFTWTKAVEPLDHFIRHPTPPRRFADRPFLVPGIGRFPGGLSYLIQRIEVRLRRFPRAHCFLSRIAKSGIDCWRKQRKG